MPVMTLVRGRIVARDGEPVATAAGHGRMLRPHMPAPRPRNVATSPAQPDDIHADAVRRSVLKR